MNKPSFRPFSRREFLWRFGGGLGAVALAQLLGEQGLFASDASFRPRPEFNGGLHHRAKVKRVIQLFMNGGASQCDMFDYKPNSSNAADKNLIRVNASRRPPASPAI